MSLELGAGRAAVILRATTALFFTVHLSLSRSEEACGDEVVSTSNVSFECFTIDAERRGSNTSERVMGVGVKHG